MAKFVKLIPLLIAVALLAGVPSAVSGQAPGEPFAWNPAADLHFPPANEDPQGIWSDETTIWVADDARDKIYAYTLATKQRDPAEDFDTLIAAGNVRPQGLWSDGTTMWVSDYGEIVPHIQGGPDEKIYAYDLSTKQRDPSKDFDTLKEASNGLPRGIWSNGSTMWVADLSDDKIYAYNMATKQRDSTKDFDSREDAGNQSPSGLWSYGTTMWVADSSDSRLYAYNMLTKGARRYRGLLRHPRRRRQRSSDWNMVRWHHYVGFGP